MSLLKLDETCDTVNNFSVYQKELNKKNKQIIELENKIKELMNNNNNNNNCSHISHMTEKSNNQSQIHNSSYTISFQNNISQNHMISLIQVLQRENDILKSKLNEDQKIEDKFSNTIQFKLLSAKDEIENLKKMNTNKDNIIMAMQNFLNNINKIISNEKINLNFNQIDIKTFSNNLKELEQEIISKLHNTHRANKIPQSSNKNKINKINKVFPKKQNTETGFNLKKFYNKIPIKNEDRKRKMCIKSSFNRNTISNMTFNKGNYMCPKCCKNKNECNDIRCLICRNKSKKSERFYKERKDLRLKGYLLTKPEGIFSRTPKKLHYKSIEGNDYNEYLQSINSSINNNND
jgi:hypothetical protein